MGSGFAKKKKEAKMFQEQFSKLQNQMQTTEVTGTAGNGLVTLILTGDGDLKSIKIKPECADPEDIEGLESLIKAAHAEAQEKLKAQSMASLPPGFPGFGAM